MPEELAIALAVLAVAGWIIYKIIQGVTRAASSAHAQVNQSIGVRRNKRYQKKRALIAPHVSVKVPHELQWAETRLNEAESDFAQKRRASVWTPVRPTWNRTDFQPHVFATQSPASGC